MKLQWNVYKRSMNRKNIETFNIFNHAGFLEATIKHLKNSYDKEKFATELKIDLMYYFAYKYEYEIGVTEPFPSITKEEIERLNRQEVQYRTHVELEIGKKVDIYQQIVMNYSQFIDYIWQNKEEVLKNND